MPSASNLQPSSVLAAASALAAAAAAGFTGTPASSTVIAAGKAGAAGKPASGSMVPGPAGASTPGVLCSGEPAAQLPSGIAAAAAVAGAAWQMQLEQRYAGTAGSGVQSAHALQHRSSGGGNDTSQSGIDCTPRSVPTAASGNSLSTAAPMVQTGSSFTAGHSGSIQPMAIALNGGSSGMGTPRAMETDTPGGLAPGAKSVAANTLKLSTAINIVAAANTDMQQQAQQQQQHSQQQQAPAVLSAHQRHSSGGLDVLTTNGMRGQADQASLVATGTPIKLQPGGAPAPTAAGGGYATGTGLESKGFATSAVAAFLAQQKQQQQQQYVVDAGAWTASQVPTEPRLMQDANSTGSFAQQQQQQALLMQQQLLIQQQLDMTVVGQGVGNNANRQQHMGTTLMDRLLPRLQH